MGDQAREREGGVLGGDEVDVPVVMEDALAAVEGRAPGHLVTGGDRRAEDALPAVVSAAVGVVRGSSSRMSWRLGSRARAKPPHAKAVPMTSISAPAAYAS